MLLPKDCTEMQENTHMKECLSFSDPALDDLMFPLPSCIVVGNLYLKRKIKGRGDKADLPF